MTRCKVKGIPTRKMWLMKGMPKHNAWYGEGKPKKESDQIHKRILREDTKSHCKCFPHRYTVRVLRKFGAMLRIGEAMVDAIVFHDEADEE